MGTNFTKLLSSLYIGNRGDLQGDYVGTVDEVGVWDRELSADEVRDLYDYGQNFDRCQTERV